MRVAKKQINTWKWNSYVQFYHFYFIFFPWQPFGGPRTPIRKLLKYATVGICMCVIVALVRTYTVVKDGFVIYAADFNLAFQLFHMKDAV